MSVRLHAFVCELKFVKHHNTVITVWLLINFSRKNIRLHIDSQKVTYSRQNGKWIRGRVHMEDFDELIDQLKKMMWLTKIVHYIPRKHDRTADHVMECRHVDEKI